MPRSLLTKLAAVLLLSAALAPPAAAQSAAETEAWILGNFDKWSASFEQTARQDDIAKHELKLDKSKLLKKKWIFRDIYFDECHMYANAFSSFLDLSWSTPGEGEADDQQRYELYNAHEITVVRFPLASFKKAEIRSGDSMILIGLPESVASWTFRVAEKETFPGADQTEPDQYNTRFSDRPDPFGVCDRRPRFDERPSEVCSLGDAHKRLDQFQARVESDKDYAAARADYTFLYFTGTQLPNDMTAPMTDAFNRRKDLAVQAGCKAE